MNIGWLFLRFRTEPALDGRPRRLDFKCSGLSPQSFKTLAHGLSRQLPPELQFSQSEHACTRPRGVYRTLDYCRGAGNRRSEGTASPAPVEVARVQSMFLSPQDSERGKVLLGQQTPVVCALLYSVLHDFLFQYTPLRARAAHTIANGGRLRRVSGQQSPAHAACFGLTLPVK